MGSGKSRNTYFYDNDKLYFSHDAVLWGNLADSEEEAPTMPAGEYSLSFDYLLPKDIPFSFETADIEGYGHVRYTCKAKIGKTSHPLCKVQLSMIMNMSDIRWGLWFVVCNLWVMGLWFVVFNCFDFI